MKNIFEIEQLKLKCYNEFINKNYELLKEDPVEFFRQECAYYEKKSIEEYYKKKEN